MKSFSIYICSIFLMCLLYAAAYGQSISFQGQASGWMLSNPEKSPITQIGVRYIPDFSFIEKIDSNLAADIDLSFNSYYFGNFSKESNPVYEKKIKPYRAWLRLASSTFEFRAGLQKINFGSATLFRPLMWFDRLDPRDPLQLTDGVKGLLARYYFLNNSNIWLWGLYGNNDTKGYEITPTSISNVEYGGRIQIPILDGESGVSFHTRKTDINLSGSNQTINKTESVPENRIGLDGKWDIGIGVWFEAVITHTQTQIPILKYLRQWTLGTDYTFDIGNGLYALTEFFRSENAQDIFGQAQGISFSALSMNYPFGNIDRLSGIVYLEWTNRTLYRFISWQRTYDNWIIYVLGFWNPDIIQLYTSKSGNNTFAGTGIQLMLVFNH